MSRAPSARRRTGAQAAVQGPVRDGHSDRLVPGAEHDDRAAATDGPGEPWLKGEPGRWWIRLAVQPGATHTRVVGLFDGCLKLQIKAPPIEGRANEAVIAWLAERLSLPRGSIRLTSGEHSRRKRLELDSPLSSEALSARLHQGARP